MCELIKLNENQQEPKDLRPHPNLPLPPGASVKIDIYWVVAVSGGCF